MSKTKQPLKRGRGRPAIHGVRKVVVSLRLTPGAIAWLRRQGNMSAAVEDLVRAAVGK